MRPHTLSAKIVLAAMLAGSIASCAPAADLSSETDAGLLLSFIACTRDESRNAWIVDIDAKLVGLGLAGSSTVGPSAALQVQVVAQDGSVSSPPVFTLPTKEGQLQIGIQTAKPIIEISVAQLAIELPTSASAYLRSAATVSGTTLDLGPTLLSLTKLRISKGEVEVVGRFLPSTLARGIVFEGADLLVASGGRSLPPNPYWEGGVPTGDGAFNWKFLSQGRDLIPLSLSASTLTAVQTLPLHVFITTCE